MRKGLFFILSLIAAAFFISESQIVARDADAQSASAADRISMEQPQDSGQWKGNDLTVEYHYSKDSGQMDLSGEVRFSYSLVMGYTDLLSFRLAVIFLDQNGRALQEVALATNRGTLDPISFGRSIHPPPNAIFMVFKYQGEVAEAGRNVTSFWYLPVR